MLTLFDYLRHRACESTLRGVHDALNTLENEAFLEDAAQTASSRSEKEPGKLPATKSKSAAGSKKTTGKSAAAAKEATDNASDQAEQQTPAPRRRGRPPKKSPVQ